MKPELAPDAMVNVRHQPREEEPEKASLFDGIYVVTLTSTPGIAFVPEVQPAAQAASLLPENPDDLTSSEEARRLILATSAFSVTPNPVRAGTTEHLMSFDPDVPVPVVIYVDRDQFARFQRELAEISELTPWIYSTVPWRDIQELTFAQFILSEVLTNRRSGGPR